MCETDFESEYKEKILDYKLWIDKAEELLEVAGFLVKAEGSGLNNQQSKNGTFEAITLLKI